MACVVCHEIYAANDDNPADSDEKPHQCTICGLSFTFKIQLKRHAILHADGAPYTCKYCVKDDENKGKTYNLRLGSKSEYTCLVCQKSFSNKRMLLRHSIQHTYESEEGSEEGIKITIKKHVTSPNAKNLSKKISEQEPIKLSIKKHCSTTTSKTKSLQCDECNRSFTYQACLDKHIKMGKCSSLSSSKLSPKHFGEDISKTDDDLSNSKAAESEKRLSDNSVKTDSKKHVCSICGKSFARKSSLDGHELQHILNKETSEDERVYFSDSELSDEPEQKKPRISTFRFQKSYTCDKCNFVCFSKPTLDKHQNNHKPKDSNSSEVGKDGQKGKENSESLPKGNPSCGSESLKELENDESFKCEKCKRKFRSKTKFQKHNCAQVKKTKNIEECEICGEEFNSKRDLKNHLFNHIDGNTDDSSMDKKDIFSKQHVKGVKNYAKGVKNFACEICGRRFAGEICLKKHQLKHEDEAVNSESGTSTTRIRKSKTVKELICEYCNEEFTGKRSAYIKHIHAHTPEVCGICDERFIDRQSLREHCKIHVGTEEGRMFMQCSQKALDAKNGVIPPEPKVEYIYLVLR